MGRNIDIDRRAQQAQDEQRRLRRLRGEILRAAGDRPITRIRTDWAPDGWWPKFGGDNR